MSNTNSTYYNPWIDIASYQIDDAFRFKGREEDLEKFLRIIDNRTMSVLYANSGIGKTSFINAGIIPEMKSMGFLPIRVIIPDTLFESGDIAVWLYERFFSLKEENEGQEANTYYWKSHTDEIIDGSDTSLWWLLHTSRIHERGTDRTYIPFIVFDQFEEVFIKSQKRGEKCGDFLEDFFGIIQDMASKVMPSYLRRKLEEKTNKEGRFISIGSFHEYKVIFSLRNEYLSDFDYWTNDKFIVTELYRNRMYLLPLTRAQAIRVITEQPNSERDGECIDTLNEIQDSILDKIDEKSGDIEPLMLSVLCSRLYDEARSKRLKRLTKQDVESINMDTLISKFYIDTISSVITDVKQLSEFEEQMVDKDNHRNKVKTSQILGGKFDEKYKIIKNNKTVETSYKKELEDKHIIRTEKFNNDDYVELIHDRLVEVVVERCKNEEKRKKYQKRVQDNLNVLGYRGRRLLDNTLDFGGFSNALVDSPIPEENRVFLADNLIDFNYRHAFIDEKNVTNSFLSIDGKRKGIIQIEYKNENGIPIRTIEGFNKIRVQYVEVGLCIHFIDSMLGNIDRPFYIRGYNGIVVKYETLDNQTGHKREIERTYVDEYDNPVMTVDGYAKVVRIYDQYGNLGKVLFYDNQGNPCKHRNGNYGFISTYNELGQEIRRIFVDEKGDPQTVQSGIYGREFKYNDLDQIIQEINLSLNNNSFYPGEDKDGYCAVEFHYDDKNRLSREIYLNKDLKRMTGHRNFCITDTEYHETSEGLIVVERYLDESEMFVKDRDGSYVMRTTYNNRFQILKDEILDDKMLPDTKDLINPTSITRCEYRNSVLSSVGYYYKTGEPIYQLWVQLDKRNQYIEQIGELDKTLSGYSFSDHIRQKEDNGTYGRLYYRDRYTLRPISYGFINIAGKRVSTFDGVYECRIEHENGNILKEFYYDVKGKPVKDGIGVYGREFVYLGDNCISESYVDEKGNIKNNIYGYALKKSEYDNRTGFCTRVCFFNDKEEPCPDENGNYTIVYSKDESLLVETELGLDEIGNPGNNNDLCIKRTTKDTALRTVKIEFFKKNWEIIKIEEYIYNDEKHQLTSRTIDDKGQLVADEKGVACIYIFRDDMGRVVASANIDKKDGLVVDDWGDFIKSYMYHDNGYSILSLDKCGNLHLNNKGYAIVRIELDEYGRIVRQFYYNTKYNPIMNREGLFGVEHKYYDCDGYANSKGEVITHLNEQEIPAMNQYGVFKIINEYNRQGLIIRQQYFDFEGNPQRVNRCYGILNQFIGDKCKQKKLRVPIKSRKIKHKVLSLQVTTDGCMRSSGLEGYFILLKYNNWKEGIPFESLEEEMKILEQEDKGVIDMMFIKLDFMDYGMSLGEVYHKLFQFGKLGARIKEINVPESIYQELRFIEND